MIVLITCQHPGVIRRPGGLVSWAYSVSTHNSPIIPYH